MEKSHITNDGILIQLVKKTKVASGEIWYMTKVNGDFVHDSLSTNVSEAEVYFDRICEANGLHFTEKVIKEVQL